MITAAQQKARDCFDLDAAMAALPPEGPHVATTSTRGAAGVRLRACFIADVSDALLREMARETLGAVRCSEQYLDALRVILGNQAHAERYGYTLEMNLRVSFASVNVMRTIIDQMQAAGVAFGSLGTYGLGRSQVVRCFSGRAGGHMDPAEELEFRDRQQEAEDDIRREAAEVRGEFPNHSENRPDPYLTITAADVPF